MYKKYLVKLLLDERADLEQLISTGTASARKLLHARILLKADSGEAGPNWNDDEISQVLEVSTATVQRVRQLFVEEGLSAALVRKRPMLTKPPKIDGELEAHLIALACSPVPSGRAHWSIRLLADKMVELGYIESIGRETIRVALKKTNLNPG